MKKKWSMVDREWSIVNSRWLMVLVTIAVTFLISCNSPYGTRKRGYYNIELPAQHTYQKFEKEGFPYSFEYPVYGDIIQDSTYFDSTPENPYWINVDFPNYGGRIFLSYKEIGGKAMFKIKQPDGTYKDTFGINVFDKLVADAFKLTSKNDVVSSSIKETLITTPNNVSGVFFNVGGNAATSMQFFLTDTTKNFLRGALYFNTTPNSDSIKPVQDFLKEDIEHMINTFKWTNKKATDLQ